MNGLKNFEKMQNVKLPEIYKDMYTSEFRKLSGRDRLCLSNEDIIISSFLDINKISEIIEEYHDLLGYNIIPFAETKYKDYICFYYNELEKPSIIFWSYELALENPNEAIFYICNDFNEFLQKLK